MEDIMKHGITKGLYSLLGLLVIIFTSACHHEVAKAQPNVPPAPPAPTAAISANPAYIQHGQSTTVSWHTTNANDIDIQGLGSVPAEGSRTLYPPESSTYVLVAKGPGGTGDASARVTVTEPAPSASSGQSELPFDEAVKDVFFDYNRFNIRPNEMHYIETDAQYLERHGSTKIVVEGHCDERGSEEYNLALGAKRATAVEKALVQLGVPAAHIKTISYGKERPFCTKSDESCWQKNRRGHFTARQ
jgi:peptidoglycan-associated lipoprotein